MVRATGMIFLLSNFPAGRLFVPPNARRGVKMAERYGGVYFLSSVRNEMIEGHRRRFRRVEQETADVAECTLPSVSGLRQMFHY